MSKVIHEHHIIENRDGQRFRTDTTIPLSVEEHANIHKQYYEKWGFQEDRVAWKTLSGQIGKEELFIETSRIGGLNNKGKKKTPEHRKKISDANKGQNASFHNLTNEQREKHRQGCMGNKNFDINKPGVRKTHRNGMLKYWEDVRAGRVKRKGYTPNVS